MITKAFDVQQAVQRALNTIDTNMVTFADRFPGDTTTNNIYTLRRARDGFFEGGNFGWTTGFWTGVLWLAYELTGKAAYRQGAERHLQSFVERLENRIDLDTHDIGFLYTLSCIVPWRLTGNTQAKEMAVQAAERLIGRYLDKVGIIQAWGSLDNPEQRGSTIIDSLMNLPLLYWASEVTGEQRFAQVAQRHAAQLRDHVVRPDSTTYHIFYWDVETGQPLRGSTVQGYADTSCWARGQAWAIYGFTMSFRYTSDETFLRTAECCADYFLDHLPADHVACWDLVFGDSSDQERDSSAAAIAVCGLLELANQLPDGERKERYQVGAENILTSLVRHYTPVEGIEANALLLHGVYDKPKSVGIDEGNLWGDYFYLEALTRILKPGRELYW